MTSVWFFSKQTTYSTNVCHRRLWEVPCTIHSCSHSQVSRKLREQTKEHNFRFSKFYYKFLKMCHRAGTISKTTGVVVFLTFHVVKFWCYHWSRRKQMNCKLCEGRTRLSLEVEIALHVLKRPVFWQKLLIHSWAFTQRRFSENCWRLSRIFLASFLYLYIIICYTVNWVRLEGGQEQYFPQNPVAGPSRREGGGFFKKYRFVCGEDCFEPPSPGLIQGGCADCFRYSSIIMHLQTEGCDVWCRKKIGNND